MLAGPINIIILIIVGIKVVPVFFLYVSTFWAPLSTQFFILPHISWVIFPALLIDKAHKRSKALNKTSNNALVKHQSRHGNEKNSLACQQTGGAGGGGQASGLAKWESLASGRGGMVNMRHCQPFDKRLSQHEHEPGEQASWQLATGSWNINFDIKSKLAKRERVWRGGGEEQWAVISEPCNWPSVTAESASKSIRELVGRATR